MEMEPTPAKSQLQNFNLIRAKHLRDRGTKFGQGEWLVETYLVAFSQIFLSFFVYHISRNEDQTARHFWIIHPQPFIHLLAVQTRHFPVTKRQVVAVLGHIFERRFAVARYIHLIS